MLWLWIHIRIYLEINPDLSIQKSGNIRINFQLYPVFSPNHPDLSGNLSGFIRITIHWIEIRFYPEVMVQYGSIRKFVKVVGIFYGAK